MPVMVRPKPKNKFMVLMEEYNMLLKSKSRNTEAEVNKREKFSESLSYLFDIAGKDAELLLKKDRLLDSEAKSEDIRSWKIKGGQGRDTWMEVMRNMKLQ